MIEIDINELKFRRNVRTVSENDPKVQALARSMGENGQEVPIQVFETKYGYFIKFGHRRVAAASLLGWSTIKAEVVPEVVSDGELIIAQYTENVEREGLTLVEKGNAYQALKELGYTQADIARRCGVSDADVSLAISATRLDPKLQEALNSGELSASAAELLFKLPVTAQEELADAVIHAKTVKRVKELVDAWSTKQGEYQKEKKVMEDEDEDNDIDPLEEMAASELEIALVHMRLAEQTHIQHPELRNRVRPTVEELVKKAAVLKEYLDGETWDDTTDLL